jgi:hypothetical protein
VVRRAISAGRIIELTGLSRIIPTNCPTLRTGRSSRTSSTSVASAISTTGAKSLTAS